MTAAGKSDWPQRIYCVEKLSQKLNLRLPEVSDLAVH
jgi:hypothetical protein